MTVIIAEPDRCPGCNNVENKKTVCVSCGYAYGKPASFLEELLSMCKILVTAVVLGWACFTLLFWLLVADRPLLLILGSQFKWLIERLDQLRLW